MADTYDITRDMLGKSFKVRGLFGFSFGDAGVVLLENLSKDEDLPLPFYLMCNSEILRLKALCAGVVPNLPPAALQIKYKTYKLNISEVEQFRRLSQFIELLEKGSEESGVKILTIYQDRLDPTILKSQLNLMRINLGSQLCIGTGEK